MGAMSKRVEGLVIYVILGSSLCLRIWMRVEGKTLRGEKYEEK